jgi:hypothetical protein
MANPAVAVASNPYNPYVPVMSGMPPPPPSYDQAMHHPVAPPNYNASYMPVQVRNVSLLTFLSKFNEQDLFYIAYPAAAAASAHECPRALLSTLSTLSIISTPSTPSTCAASPSSSYFCCSSEYIQYYIS